MADPLSDSSYSYWEWRAAVTRMIADHMDQADMKAKLIERAAEYEQSATLAMQRDQRRMW